MPLASSLAGQGESLACRHLQDQGFSIIVRNFRIRLAEIDIIARRGDLVCFVEVKTRRSLARGPGVLAVTPAKLRKMLTAARGFIAAGRARGCRYRFDVIEVTWPAGEPPRIRWFENVLQVD